MKFLKNFPIAALDSSIINYKELWNRLMICQTDLMNSFFTGSCISQIPSNRTQNILLRAANDDIKWQMVPSDPEHYYGTFNALASTILHRFTGRIWNALPFRCWMILMDEIFESCTQCEYYKIKDPNEYRYFGKRIWYTPDIFDDSSTMFMLYSTLLFGNREFDECLLHYVEQEMFPKEKRIELTDHLITHDEQYYSCIHAYQKTEKYTLIQTKWQCAHIELPPTEYMIQTNDLNIPTPLDILALPLPDKIFISEVIPRLFLKHVMPCRHSNFTCELKERIEKLDSSIPRVQLLNSLLIQNSSDEEWQALNQANWNMIRSIDAASSNLIKHDKINVRVLSFVLMDLMARYIHMVLFVQTWLLPLWNRSGTNIFKDGIQIGQDITIYDLHHIVNEIITIWSMFQVGHERSCSPEELSKQLNILGKKCWGYVGNAQDGFAPLPQLCAPRFEYNKGVFSSDLLKKIVSTMNIQWENNESSSGEKAFLRKSNCEFVQKWIHQINYVMAFRETSAELTNRMSIPRSLKLFTNKVDVWKAVAYGIEQSATVIMPIKNDDVAYICALWREVGEQKPFSSCFIKGVTCIEQTSYRYDQIDHKVLILNNSIDFGNTNSKVVHLSNIENCEQKIVHRYGRSECVWWIPFSIDPQKISCFDQCYSQKKVQDTSICGRQNFLRWNCDGGAIVKLAFAPYLESYHRNLSGIQDVRPYHNVSFVNSQQVPGLEKINYSAIPIHFVATQNGSLRIPFISKHCDILYESKDKVLNRSKKGTDQTKLVSELNDAPTFCLNRQHKVIQGVAQKIQQSITFIPSVIPSEPTVSSHIMFMPCLISALLPITRELSPNTGIYMGNIKTF